MSSLSIGSHFSTLSSRTWPGTRKYVIGASCIHCNRCIAIAIAVDGGAWSGKDKVRRSLSFCLP